MGCWRFPAQCRRRLLGCTVPQCDTNERAGALHCQATPGCSHAEHHAREETAVAEVVGTIKIRTSQEATRGLNAGSWHILTWASSICSPDCALLKRVHCDDGITDCDEHRYLCTKVRAAVAASSSTQDRTTSRREPLCGSSLPQMHQGRAEANSWLRRACGPTLRRLNDRR